MRALMLALVGAVGLAVASPTAGGAPLASGVPAPVFKAAPAASHGCPKGQRWVPAGYAKHGKYRAAHCAPK